MKKQKPMRLLKERPQKEQQHYTNILLEEIRSQNMAVIDRMELGFQKIYEDMGAMEERLNLRIDVCVFAIEKLQKQVSVLERDVGILKSDVGILKSDVRSLKESVTAIEVKVSALEVKVSALEVKVSALEVKVSAIDSKIDRIWEKEKEQDREIEILKAQAHA